MQLIAVVVALLVVLIIMVALLLGRLRSMKPPSEIMSRLEGLEKSQARLETDSKNNFEQIRRDSATEAHRLREEVSTSIKHSSDSLVQSVNGITELQRERLEDFSARINGLTQSNETANSQLRSELTNALSQAKDAVDKRLSENSTTLENQFESFGRRLSEFGQTSQDAASLARTELSTGLKNFKDSLQIEIGNMVTQQRQHFDSFGSQLADLTERNEKKSDELRAAVEGKLGQIQTDNAAKLDEMRATVDEKLQGTLDRRLGESFQIVSERLEQVHQGLGQMQVLASGVGDLKKVLTNVKTRGTWGEIQLGNLLEQILTPEQFERNVKPKPASGEIVEYAIKLPGREEGDGKVWLPIDVKFPKEDYEVLVDASERGDADTCEQAIKSLEAGVRAQARAIRDKYIAPPYTTDFGLLYLPTEGLYAEVLRRPGLVDAIQRESRVVIVGPTTLAALLNSLQMGFRSLAVQKHSSEVWKVLGAVKTEFGKFGDMLDKVKKKLDETGNTIDDAVHRSRQIERKLRKVEALPLGEEIALLTETIVDSDSIDTEEAN